VQGLFNFPWLRFVLMKMWCQRMMTGPSVKLIAAILSLAAHFGMLVAYQNPSIIRPGTTAAVNRQPIVLPVDTSRMAVRVGKSPKTITKKNKVEPAASMMENAQLPALIPMTDTSSLIAFEMLSQPYYFPVQEITEKPQVTQDVEPELPIDITEALPPAAIRLLINEYGDVDQVEFEDANYPAVAMQVISDNFKKMKFRPGTYEGIPVKTQMRIEVVLEPIIKWPLPKKR
jgi:hypothetical protein